MISKAERESVQEVSEQALELCEVTLSNALRRQLEAAASVGAQLTKIREGELYRAAGCETFELYCRKVLEMPRDRVDRFLAIAEVVETIRATGLELPATEIQAVMLAKIPREKLTGCWRTLLTLCAREQVSVSDRVVRRAVAIALAETKVESGERCRRGVQVTLEL